LEALLIEKTNDLLSFFILPHQLNRNIYILKLSNVIIDSEVVLEPTSPSHSIPRLRQIVLENEDLRRELAEMRKQTDERFQIVFETLDELTTIDNTPKKKIGFEVKKGRTAYGKKIKKQRAGGKRT